MGSKTLQNAVAISSMMVALGVAPHTQRSQTLAPHELGNSDAPPPIIWETPALPARDLHVETAEERSIRVSVVVKHLEQPWSVAFMPDGAMLITERPGRLRIVRKGRLESEPVPGTPTVHTGGARGLQGLMDVALHPHFAANHWIYLTYHKPTPAGGGATTLARGTWDGTALTKVRDIFESHAEETEASRIVFGRDGMIYMSISAPGSPEVRRSQDPTDYAGKIVRLREDGSVPSDNPFAADAHYRQAIYTVGHRNGHGLAVNPGTGEIWQSEQGPSGGDEVNVLRAGKNYGWPFISYGRNYSGSAISAHPSQDGFENPAVVWLPSIGITGMTFYRGDAFPHWRRNLFVAGLREGEVPRTGHLERIVFNDRWEELRRESLLTELKQRLRDVREAPDGTLYVLTAEDDGALLRIEPR